MPKQKTIADLKKKAWGLLSQVIRREAANSFGHVNCYTCNKLMDWKEAQAGHAIGGRTGAVLLDEEIIRCQCYRCNVPLRGNYPEFTTRLIVENGIDWWQNKLEQSKQIRKWKKSELDEKIESLKARLKELDAQNNND